MQFATGALGTLLPKLGKLLQDEYNLQKSVKKDIQFLTDELESTGAALRKIGDMPQEQLDEQVKIWAREVRELSYDMEDVVDTFLVQVQGADTTSRSSSKRFVRKMVKMFTKGTMRHHIAEEIKEIKERVTQLAARRDRCRVDDINPTTTTLIDPRLTALYTQASDLIGIDETREQVISRLFVGGKQQRIVSIVGFGGLGKTTLAKAVCDKIKNEFQCTALVTVSKNFDMKRVFMDILYELDRGKYGNIHTTMLELKQLVDLVKGFLNDKRYLIVIDDMWDITPWKILTCALSENNTGSRIIITTRIIDVAKHIGGFFELKPFTHENSKILFYRRIFESEDKCPSQFYEVSEKILSKCGGVPLAILTTSSLLADKLGDINEWHELCDSIGSGLGGSHDLDNMRNILYLSYYDLPSHLKTCLLYLSIFPEDYVFRRDRLIWRWIAEDFVCCGETDRSLFEVGENYFKQLCNRSLIQPYMDEFGLPRTCRMHDMVLDLIRSLSKEESFVTTTSGDTSMPSSRSNVRRLSLHSTICPAKGMPKLRSLSIFGGASVFDSMPSLSSFNLLRVLDLEGCNLTNRQGLRFLGDLLHLRYLSLLRTKYGGKLPDEVGKLQFLQILDLRGARITEVPTSLVRLRQLMCLYVGIHTRLPSGLRKIISLEMLSGAMDSTFIVEDLRHLTQLRQLQVGVLPNEEGRSDLNPVKALLESLGNLRKIKDLQIWGDYRAGVDLEGSLESRGSLRRLFICEASLLPTWINPASLSFLSILHITILQMGRGDIQVLGTLPALCYLYLDISSSIQIKERFPVSVDAFPCLRECTFSGFEIVPSILPAGAMARLETFQFSICLEDFVSGDFEDLAMDHLPSLRSVCVCINTHGIAEEVILRVEEMLKHKAAVHPNHPSIHIEK
ncbi:hypothetical protein EJB05_26061, partial [Eragrostis curvula]